MPLYDYMSRDGSRVVTLVRPVSARNLPVMDSGERLERVTCPQRINVVLGRTPPKQGDKVLSGYHREECRHGSRFRSEFTASQIKRAWSNDNE